MSTSLENAIIEAAKKSYENKETVYFDIELDLPDGDNRYVGRGKKKLNEATVIQNIEVYYTNEVIDGINHITIKGINKTH